MKLLSWNMGHRTEAWRSLLESDADLALLQEACAPPSDVASRIQVDDEPWRTAGVDANRPWRTAVVRLSDRVQVNWHRPYRIDEVPSGRLGVSRPGTLAAAEVTTPDGSSLTVVSVYGVWDRPHEVAKSQWIYADASVHRVISDVAVFVGQQGGHRILVAGDLNILHGYGEAGSLYWAGRYKTVFDRMRAIGLPFVGPQAPNGRIADPWPSELPRDSKNVPTYHTNRGSPATAERQLDFVFASTAIAKQLRIRANNDPDRWGPSDHCQVGIELWSHAA